MGERTAFSVDWFEREAGSSTVENTDEAEAAEEFEESWCVGRDDKCVCKEFCDVWVERVSLEALKRVVEVVGFGVEWEA